MNVYKVESIVRALGAREVSTKDNMKVRCNCLLAQWTHAKGRDSRPSMVILEGGSGDPIYACRTCHESGPLRDLVLLYMSKTGADLFPFIEYLDGESEQVPKGVDATIHQARKRVLKITHEEIEKKKIERQIKDAGGTDEDIAWHNKEAIREAEEVLSIPWSHYEPFIGSIPRYALDRGLTIETCKAWELGHDKRMRRLLIPMRDRSGRLVAVSGRRYACQWCGSSKTTRENRCVECRHLEPDGVLACSRCGEPTGDEERCAGCKKPSTPKYLHNDGFKRNLHLFGENRVQDGDSLVYVVEGHLDALILWQFGYRPVVALLGSAPGDSQIEKLIAYYNKVLVVPDGDAAGRKMAEEIRAKIAWRIPVMARIPKEGKDPGGMGADGLLDLLGPPPFDVAA